MLMLKDVAEACKELGLSCVWPATISFIASLLVEELEWSEEELRKILRNSSSDRVRRAARRKLVRLNGSG
jgi:hypothetical protein